MSRYFTVLNLLLITIAVYLSVNAFYGFTTSMLDSSDAVIVPQQEIPSPVDDIQQPFSHYKTISQRDLFNTKTEKDQKTKEEVNIEELKPTQLNLKLWGTVMNDGGRAYAVIEDAKERKQNLYRVGDTIQNATVKMILREKVILSVNNKDEILQMEKLHASARVPSRSKAPGGSQTQNITLKRADVDSAVKNVNNLLGQVRIRPHFEGGKPSGLSLTGIKPNSIFSNMGLRSGDVLTGVNGKEIESVDDVLKLYENLRSSSNVKLDLKRRGKTQTIDYNIEN